MSNFAQDLRYAIRLLRKSPGFATVAVLTLALGIGANTAVFTIVNSVLLAPLPLPHPERLAFIWQRTNHIDQASISYPDWQDLRAQNQNFASLEAFSYASFNLRSPSRPERVAGARVSAGYLSMLRANPILGRTFAAGEDGPVAAKVAVIREELWRRDFGANPKLVGSTISLDGESYTVVGVMPSMFRFPALRSELWIPLLPGPTVLKRGNHFMRMVGRLKPGRSVNEARAEMDALSRRLAAQYPTDDGNRIGARVIPLREEITGNVRQILIVLLGAVAFVFFIACANVANLLLARASGRRQEVAIRRALGAGQRRLASQFLAEGLILAALSAVSGWLLALWTLDLVMKINPAGIPRLNEVSPDPRALCFTIAISVLAAVGFGCVSLLQCVGWSLHGALQGSARVVGSNRGWLRNALVIGEVATALVLLIGAGLMVESFWRLQRVDPGFRPEPVLTLMLNLPPAKYRTQDAVSSFYQPLLARTTALPSVEAAGFIDILPIQSWGVNGDFQIEGRPPFRPDQAPTVEQRIVGGDYFRAMGIPLVAGRFLSQVDARNAMPAVVINQTFARQYFPNQNPIGKRIRYWSEAWVTIVGVAGDIRQSGLDHAAHAELYSAYGQSPANSVLDMSMVVRTAVSPTSVISEIRKQVQAIDPEQPVSKTATMKEVLSASIADRGFSASLLSSFAMLALFLASLGIYGVISYTVRQRTREIGIRVALGAASADVIRTVTRNAMSLVGAGLLIGLAGAAALTRVLSASLFAVSATDPLTFAAVALILAGVAFVASFIPARRASRIDPMVALRHE